MARPDRTLSRPGRLQVPIFAGVPYLLVHLTGALRQVTLLPADRPPEWLDDLARQQVHFNRLDVALVLAAGRAIVHDARNGASTEQPAPRGGLLVAGRLLPAERLPATDELADRAAQLAAYLDQTQRDVGYVLGDLTRGGRPATLEERVRLEGTQPNGVPRGLVECEVCHEWAGTCLDRAVGAEDQVLQVHCRCANDNRCAWCDGPLAPSRLNANFYDRRRDEIWHVPGFEALGHRCRHATDWDGPAPTDPRTADEQVILDVVARGHGRGWAERHAHLILEQARAIGEL